MNTIKNLVVCLALTITSAQAFAQSAYEKSMTEKIVKVQESESIADLEILANDFNRISLKETKEWLPNYYAALALLRKGRILMRENKLAELDAVAAEAQKSIDAGEAISPKNVELKILNKMVHSLKMMVDPMSRFQSEGMLAANFLDEAEAIDSQNPRITLLKAEDTYHTPEQFGGSKEKGLELFSKATAQFAVYKSINPLSPTWGKEEARAMVSQIK